MDMVAGSIPLPSAARVDKRQQQKWQGRSPPFEAPQASPAGLREHQNFMPQPTPDSAGLIFNVVSVLLLGLT